MTAHWAESKGCLLHTGAKPLHQYRYVRLLSVAVLVCICKYTPACITCIRSIQRALIPLTREWKSFVVYFLAKAQVSLHNHTGIDCTCHVSLHTCSTEVLHLQNVYNCAISV